MCANTHKVLAGHTLHAHAALDNCLSLVPPKLTLTQDMALAVYLVSESRMLGSWGNDL